MTQKVLRGRVLSFNDAPKARDDQDCYTYLEDGALLIEGGVIVARGAFADVKAQAQDSVEMVDHRPHIITAGLLIPTFISHKCKFWLLRRLAFGVVEYLHIR